jgi:hypothetical protein
LRLDHDAAFIVPPRWRSAAEAAREIKGLILASSEEVGSGK